MVSERSVAKYMALVLKRFTPRTRINRRENILAIEHPLEIIRYAYEPHVRPHTQGLVV